MTDSEREPQEAWVQYAALPFRRRPDGSIEIFLITSRRSRRWIIPKGWPIEGVLPADTACREALEEAGLLGRVGQEPFGSFSYLKRLGPGRRNQCEVRVFPMLVERRRRRWREMHERDTGWFSVDDAVTAVQEPELRQLIERFRMDSVSLRAAR